MTEAICYWEELCHSTARNNGVGHSPIKSLGRARQPTRHQAGKASDSADYLQQAIRAAEGSLAVRRQGAAAASGNVVGVHAAWRPFAAAAPKSTGHGLSRLILVRALSHFVSGRILGSWVATVGEEACSSDPDQSSEGAIQMRATHVVCALLAPGLVLSMGAKGGCDSSGGKPAPSKRHNSTNKTSVPCFFEVDGKEGKLVHISWLLSDKRSGTQHTVKRLPYRSKDFTCTAATIFKVNVWGALPSGDYNCVIYADGRERDFAFGTGRQTIECKEDFGN
jgi:hypothetical protein